MAQFLDLTGLSRFKSKNDGLYAKQDGYYQNLGAGVADQLSSSVGIEDKTPYNFRTTGGSADVGDRMNLKAVVGGTVAWNQIIGGYYATGATTSTADGIVTVTPTSSGNRLIGAKDSNTNSTKLPNGHKGYVSVIIKSDGEHSVGFQNYLVTGAKKTISASFVELSDIVSSTSNGSLVQLYSVNQTVYQIKDGSFVCFDLTLMFGSTIADYVYTLESGTAGAGIAWLKKYGWFTKPYYPYAVANLQSVKTSAHKTYGFNAYNPSTGKAKVVGGMVYQITGAYTALSLDGTSITPDANGYFTPSANGELTVTGGNSTTTCIHLKWDGERDGEWEEFSEHTYALDGVELRGIPKLDASNNLYYDGDRYLPDGTVERRYGIVDLGTLTWNTATSSGRSYSNVITDIRKGSQSSYGGHIISPLFIGKETPSMSGLNDSEMSVDDGGRLQICKTAWAGYTNAQLQTELSNVMLVYELAAATTEAADPYQQTQIVDDFGTEEFVDAAVEANERDVAIPVGHETFYQNNLKAKLEMAPNSPDGDGVYVVQQTNGENEYIPLVIPVELPTFPSDDGTYVLKITVSGGTVTKAWVEEV